MDLQHPDLATALAPRYRLVRPLGEGGMATVFLAEDLRHHRQVAVKVLRPELASALGGERFLQEIRVTARLQHPHILPLHDSGAVGDLLYYVMPYVDGEALRDRLSREGPLPVAEALRIAREVAEALGSAHREGIVHRDVKPENVLLREGHALVADFGIALAARAAGGPRLTEVGLSLGTPWYMSPEQVSGDEALDGRSDQYALACMLFEMLTGAPPFASDAPLAVLARHLTDTPVPVTTRRPEVPTAVARAIAQALAKAPGDRFGDMAAFTAALEHAPPTAAAAGTSIVVVPFVNRSADPENEYFSDGLTEELIADLSQLQALRVISHASALRLKGTGKDTRTIGRELLVDHVLTGSVRKAGTQVRITAHLADTRDDQVRWTGKYGGELDDIFAMQEQVSRAIVSALALTLTPEEDRQLAARDVHDARAYDCYLRARADVLLTTREGIERAIRLLQEGLAIEGENALLLAMLGYARVVQLKMRLAVDEAAERRAIDDCLARLTALDAGSPHAAFLRGMIAYERGELRRAIDDLTHAFRHDPNRPEVLVWLLTCLLYVGRSAAEVAPLFDHLQAIDPLTPMHLVMRAAFDAFEGRLTVALPLAERGVALDPGVPDVLWSLSYMYALDGQLARARGVFARLEAVAAAYVYTQQLGALLDGLDGDHAAARARLTPAVVAAAAEDHHLALHLAESFAVIGDRDEALRCLGIAVEHGFVHHPFFTRHNPFLAPLLGDPACAALLARTEEEWRAFAAIPVPTVG